MLKGVQSQVFFANVSNARPLPVMAETETNKLRMDDNDHVAVSLKFDILPKIVEFSMCMRRVAMEFSLSGFALRIPLERLEVKYIHGLKCAPENFTPGIIKSVKPVIQNDRFPN